MKELTFQELQEIEGGGFWDGFCTGIGIADGAYAIGAGLAYYGVITVFQGLVLFLNMESSRLSITILSTAITP